MSFKLNSNGIGLLWSISILLICNSCSQPEFEYSIETKVNPFNISPLTAQLQITTEKPCRASVKVLGESPIENTFKMSSNNLTIPVIGLYPDITNDVVVTLDYEGGQIIDTLKIKAGALPNDFPSIEINKLDRDNMESGLHGCDFHFANNGTFRSVPIIFDDQGKIRWYLDLSFHGKMVAPFQRLSDGTILMVGRFDIYEFNMLGQQLKKTKINTTYGMHHDVLEIANNQLLICVGKRDAYINIDGEKILSDNDFIVLYDRNTSSLVKEWDLAKYLDVSRNDLSFLRKGDWLHMNGLAYNEEDRSIYVSGKNQGIINISWDNKLNWILAPKRNWGKSGRDGNGFETEPFLLTAQSSNGKVYNSLIQDGTESDENFDFTWGPHAPLLLPNGNLLVFDNGAYRNFNKENKFSRAVEYKINAEDKTVSQVWQYGKERGEALYSAIVSDVDYLPNTENILMTSGFIMNNGVHQAKIIEIDYETKNEVFEATLYYKDLNGSKKPEWGQADILYRSERLELDY